MSAVVVLDLAITRSQEHVRRRQIGCAEHVRCAVQAWRALMMARGTEPLSLRHVCVEARSQSAETTVTTAPKVGGGWRGVGSTQTSWVAVV